MSRILVIEDNHDNRQLMTYLLSAFGHNVLTASDGEIGLEMLRDADLDLVVCDVHLPKKDGYQIIAAVRDHPEWTRAPMIAVTALAMVGDRNRLLSAGFDGYIAKPIEAQAFIEEIQAWLEASEPRSDTRATAHQGPAQSTEHAPVGQRTISSSGAHLLLVVDDRADNRDMFRAILEPSGYSLMLSSSAEEALDTVARTQVDLILCDLRMPGDDGLELLSKLKSDPRSASIPFMMITAASWTPRERNRAFELGALRFLEQPIDPRGLITEIVDCLGEAKEEA